MRKPQHQPMSVLRASVSRKCWKSAALAMGILTKRSSGNQLCYTTISEVALASDVSYGVARYALRTLKRVGLLRSHPPSGNRPEMFMPAAWP